MSDAALPTRVRGRADLEALLALATNWEERRLVPEPRPPFRLDRVHALLASIGDPQRGVLTVHVAGSKGKGSVARMVAATLARAGRTPVGLYTSPHLEDLAERIAIDGRPADDEALARAADRLLPHVRRTFGTAQAPTFFEILTGMGWLVFREQGCRAVVLETGLGGRLDATNVCEPSVTLITSIEREHAEILGDTIALIAGEKAGILKAGVPAGTSARGEALAVIEARASTLGVPLAVVGRDVTVGRVETGPGPQTRATLSFADGETLDLVMGVAGVHQVENAALAAVAARRLGLGDAALTQALASLCLPGVLEPLGGDPLVVADAAHTPVSARATRAAVEAAWPGRRRVLLLALLQGKDAVGIAAPLLEGAAHVITTELPTPRRVTAADLAAQLAPLARVPVEAIADRSAALARACALAGAGGLVLATGSVRLAGFVRGARRPR